MARQSVYPAASFDFLEALDACVSYTESSAESLQVAIQQFEPGVKDLPRLSKVLVNKHHFLVLPTPQIQAHQSRLSTSLAPQIETLISKAEAMVASQSERVSNLEERLAIIESARPPRPTPISAMRDVTVGGEEGEGADEMGNKLEGLVMADLTPSQRRKVVMLRGKRAKLEKELAELS